MQGKLQTKPTKRAKKITYFDLGAQQRNPKHPNTQTPKHPMYFNLATQGANFGANTATRIKINFNHQQSTKTDRQNIAPIYTTVKHKIVKAKRAKTAKSRKFKAKYTRIF